MDVVYYGKISQDFSQTNRPLIPIIFSHGLAANRTMLSGSCRNFASHGYIVFTLDHNDESSHYVENNDGVGIYLDKEHLAYDFEFRKKQILIREKETSALIDEILDQKTLLRTLEFEEEIEIDTGKIITGGHSFGGMTGIGVAVKDSRVKAVITHDPWLFTSEKEINEGEIMLEIPFLAVCSERFHPWCEF